MFFYKSKLPAFPVCDFSQTRNHNTHIAEENKSLAGREKAEETDTPWFGMFDKSGSEGVFWCLYDCRVCAAFLYE